MARYTNRPMHKPVPNTDARYVTYCKRCGRTLMRVPRAGHPGGVLAHLIIDKFDNSSSPDVVGWHSHCKPNDIEAYENALELERQQ